MALNTYNGIARANIATYNGVASANWKTFGGVDSTYSSEDPYFSNVSLLLHGEGTNGQQVFTDSSLNTKTMIHSGTVQTSTAVKKFGNTSIRFLQSTDQLYDIDSDYTLGSGDWTIEFFWYNDSWGTKMLIDFRQSGDTNAPLVYTNGGNDLRFYYNGDRITLSSGLNLHTWYHIACTRSGNDHKLFLDGTQVGSTATLSYTHAGNTINIGNYYASGYGAIGYFDEIRITRGVARYTSNFTAPSAPFPDSGGSLTFTTWNPSDKGSNVTLSNGDLTSTIVGVTGVGVRSVSSKSSGKWYWEVTVNSSTNFSPCIGIAKSSASLNDFLGKDASGWSWYGAGSQLINNNVRPAYSSFTVGDTIGVALDLDAGTLTFYKNGVSQGQAYSGLSGTFYAAVSSAQGGETSVTTTNFGDTSFAYTPPSGHIGLIV